MSQISKSQKKLLLQLFDHEQQSPLVCKLNKKIKKLKHKNKLLNNVILRFGELTPNMIDLSNDDSESDEEHIIYSIEEDSEPSSPNNTKIVNIKQEEPFDIRAKTDPFEITANTNIGSDETKQLPTLLVGASHGTTRTVNITQESDEEEEDDEGDGARFGDIINKDEESDEEEYEYNEEESDEEVVILEVEKKKNEIINLIESDDEA
jgi:hypothetical protein